MGDRASRESLREVKREYKARRKADKQRAAYAADYWDAQTGQARRRPRRSAGRTVAGLAAATAAVVAGAVVLHVGPFAGTPATSAAPSSPSPSASAPSGAPSTAPSATPSASASPDDGTDPTLVKAFEGTPAETWSSGTAGLVAPRAGQVGIFRTRQVAAAYAMTVSYLTAATTNTRVAFKGEMTPVLKALGPDFPSYAKKQHAQWVTSKGKKGISWVSLANRFHVGDWRAAATMRGRARISPARIGHGNLQVPFVVVTAYWLAPAKGGDARAVVIRRSGYLEFTGWGPNKVWLTTWRSYQTSSRSLCGSDWPYPDFLQAWVEMPEYSGPPPTERADITDPGAPDPDACYIDTSGF